MTFQRQKDEGIDVKQKSISMTNAIMIEDVKQIALRTE